MHCLDDHRARFAALVDSMPAASPGQLSKVSAAGLPPVAECGITERLFTKPLPADPTVRKRIAEVNAQLAQTEAALTLGDLARGRQLATQALATARTLGYEPLLARALSQLAGVELRGTRQSRTGEVAGARPDSMGPDRAAALLEQALRTAELGRADAERADAANALVMAHRDGGRLAEAERWAEHASAIITRIGNPPLLRAALDFGRGWIHYDRRQWEDGERRVLEFAAPAARDPGSPGARGAGQHDPALPHDGTSETDRLLQRGAGAGPHDRRSPPPRADAHPGQPGPDVDG